MIGTTPAGGLNAARVSKEGAGYERGSIAKHCKQCKSFEAPESCKRVIGRISPGAVCRLFQPKEDSK